jgi:radical SAM protein with 4Fe4S-binding SPASM domain
MACAPIYDNAEADVHFDADEASAGKRYLLEVTAPDGTWKTAPSVWLSDEADRIARHEWCSIGRLDQGSFGLSATPIYSNPVADTLVPPGLLISTATQCNLNCIHCISRPTRGALSRLASSIRVDIEGWAHSGALRSVATDYSGDILWADHRFGGDLEFLIGLGVPFHLDTNGVHLTEDVSRRLMQSRVVTVNVSLDAARDDTLRRVRRGAPPLPDLLAKMAALSRHRGAGGRSDVGLSIGFTLMRSTLDELVEVVTLARDLHFDGVIARHLEAYTPDMDAESLWHDQATFNRAREEALRLAGDLGITLAIPRAFESRPERSGHYPCHEPWRSAVVLGNGDVHVCCVPGPGTRMGNLEEQSMQAIWNGPQYQSFRRAVNSDTPPAVCAACPMRRYENNASSYVPHRAWR